jgi:hypothetical protein
MASRFALVVVPINNQDEAMPVPMPFGVLLSILAICIAPLHGRQTISVRGQEPAVQQKISCRRCGDVEEEPDDSRDAIPGRRRDEAAIADEHAAWPRNSL